MPAYDEIGGADGCERISIAFHSRVVRDPLLRSLFPKSCRGATVIFARFLGQFLGGAPGYSEQSRFLTLPDAHARFHIGPAEREAWLSCMNGALEECGVRGTVRSTLNDLFAAVSSHLIGQPGEVPSEFEAPWRAELLAEQVVEAIRAGHDPRALALADRIEDRHTLAGLLVAAGSSGRPLLLAWLHERVGRDPALVHLRRGGGQTLLHALANQGGEGAAEAVRILAVAGADVNAVDRAKRMTPLHVAARRGNVPVAATLLDVGASIEARDRLGDTPLRRAINCGRPAMVSLLVARGADINSVGRDGFTALQAARSEALRNALHGRDAHQPSRTSTAFSPPI